MQDFVAAEAVVAAVDCVAAEAVVAAVDCVATEATSPWILLDDSCL